MPKDWLKISMMNSLCPLSSNWKTLPQMEIWTLPKFLRKPKAKTMEEVKAEQELIEKALSGKLTDGGKSPEGVATRPF